MNGDTIPEEAETCPRCTSRDIKCLGWELNKEKVCFLRPLEYYCRECGLVFLNFSKTQLGGDESAELEERQRAWEEFVRMRFQEESP